LAQHRAFLTEATGGRWKQLIPIVYQVILATAIQRVFTALTALPVRLCEDANNCTDPTPVQVTINENPVVNGNGYHVDEIVLAQVLSLTVAATGGAAEQLILIVYRFSNSNTTETYFNSGYLYRLCDNTVPIQPGLSYYQRESGGKWPENTRSFSRRYVNYLWRTGAFTEVATGGAANNLYL
jgi:hypothetical protein